jgi:lysophospholipase L1-like esterase
MKDKMRGIKLFIANYSVFLTLLITLELAGQIGYLIVRGRFLYETPPNIAFEEHPYLSGMLKKNFRYVSAKGIEVTTDQHGFRITRKNDYEKNAVNIICMGGSTTFGTWVTDEDTWPYKLQEKLGSGYNVFNMGVPGYSTLEAMIQLITFAPELNPQVIIIYEGWNDIRNYHVKPQSPDYFWHGMSQKTNLEFGNRNLWDFFFISKLCKNIGQAFRADPNNLSDPEVFSSNDPYVDSLYTRNLSTIKLLCDNLKTKMIFIPQVLNLDSLRNSAGTYAWTPHIQNKQMPAMIERFNALIPKAIRIDPNTLILDDILQKYNWLPQHFVDFGHFTPEGGEFFTDIILKSLKEFEDRNDTQKLKK